jgi:hypothetical protein
MPDERQIESLARILHEAGREAVARALVLNKVPGGQAFVEWDQLPEHACEGRRIQARYLLERDLIVTQRLPSLAY